MKKVLYLILAVLLFASCSKEKSLLIEAESFENKGGWLVDPQFVEQMGSPYMLAHGYGIPVENASTNIVLPGKGKYKVWVRTMNWAPGDWDAPGRFRVALNDNILPADLGTTAGWGWEYAGTVKATIESKLELLDLTGFEGRCDAILLTTGKNLPPSESNELANWRKELLQSSDKAAEQLNFDLVVVGGGIAGCAASIAAAEMGLKVALIHDRPVLGGNSSSEIRVHTEGVTGDYERILSKLNTVHWPNGSPDAIYDDRKRHESMEEYQLIKLFLNWRAYDVTAENDSITAVFARHTSTGQRKTFSAPVYIDCTGDGWIGFWAGADYMYGREPADQFDEQWNKYGELWSPSLKDNKVMGSSVLWRTARAEHSVDFPEVPWAMDVVGDFGATAGTWKWEYSNDTMHQVDDGEAIRDHMLRAIYGSFYNAKQQDGNENLRLEWMSYLLGKRESRRLVGDHILSFKDVRDLKRYEDEVAYGVRPVDVHYQQDLLDPGKPDFLSEALYYYVDYYYIPFRSLYSKNIKNLMMAGRNFSCSHIGLGGPRVMNTTGQMGAATGFAASLCHRYKVNPRSVYKDYIEELKAIIEEQK